MLWQQKIKLHKWWICVSLKILYDDAKAGVYIYPHVRYYTLCIRDETMNGGTNKTLSRENIGPLTSFRVYLNDPLDLFASNVLFEGMCIANTFSDHCHPVMLWLFPQVLLQGVIIAIGILYNCDTGSLWPIGICWSCSSWLISSLNSKMLILNNFLQPIRCLYDGEYVWELDILTKFDVLNLV